MLSSQFASQLHCIYCHQLNVATEWPRNGDMTPFYNQTKEDTQEKPGVYRVPVHCSQCGKDWFVVWDSDPQ